MSWWRNWSRHYSWCHRNSRKHPTPERPWDTRRHSKDLLRPPSKSYKGQSRSVHGPPVTKAVTELGARPLRPQRCKLHGTVRLPFFCGHPEASIYKIENGRQNATLTWNFFWSEVQGKRQDERLTEPFNSALWNTSLTDTKKRGASFEAPLPVSADSNYCTVKVSDVKCCTLPEVPITRTL